LRTWAQIIGNTNDASVLQSILNEEEQADKILTQVASRVNYQAAA
jgi:ferritin-like metal-binding protein YciE